ncbi:MAG: serine protease [Chthoniobacteraceae bacterium]|nr:serine protease [Chthoniobacteraceae bacterium]
MKRLLAIAALLPVSFSVWAAEPVIPAAYPKPTGAQLAQTFPYSMIGQLLFENGRSFYSGSGTVIRPKSVLTAGHILYDFDGGWSTNLLFQRGLYGKTGLSEQYATRIYVLGGYRESVNRYGGDDVRAFSHDMGGLVFPKPLANGSTAGWSSDTSLLTGTSYNIAFGYGAEFHTGDDLLSVVPTAPFESISGAFLENRSLYFESGMSGGPVFARGDKGLLFVSGIVVSGSTDPVAGGIRALNSTAAAFIQRYLR